MQKSNATILQELLNIPSTKITANPPQESSVTTSWGVDWNEDMIARDLMQNFYDANRNQIEEVVVTEKESLVIVSAPSTFQLERLFYLGSEKGDSDIGQYGEGFKVAAVCLLRDHKVTPICVSGDRAVVLGVKSDPVAGTNLLPLTYQFFNIQPAVKGTKLFLTDCKPKLRSSLILGMTHFFHHKNPLLGNRLWGDADSFAIYESTTSTGHVFYRNLKRAEMKDIRLVLIINKTYQAMENKISSDRDRNFFGEDILRLFFNLFARHGVKTNPTVGKIIVKAAESAWERGHPLLSEMGSQPYQHKTWPLATTREIFGDRFYTRGGKIEDTSKELEVKTLLEIWMKEGKRELPRYFRKFGVLSAEDVIDERLAMAKKEARELSVRTPTEAELSSIKLLTELLELLAPEILTVLRKGECKYTVATTETLLGELRSGRGYHSREVFLAAVLFESEFSRAVAIFLHEHAHIFGYDGSRGFTDALTKLIESLIEKRSELERLAVGWEVARKKVKTERKKMARSTSTASSQLLTNFSKEQLLALLRKLSDAEITKLLESETRNS